MDANNNEEQTKNTNNSAPTLEDSSPTVNLDSLENQKLGQQNAKASSGRKFGIIVAVVVMIVGVLFLLLNTAENVLWGPDIHLYESYLNDKYGEGEKFSYTGRMDDSGGCPYFNVGWCTRMFISEKTGKEFAVKYDKHSNSEFSDKYYLAEYGDELEEYYQQIFSESFKEIIPYNFTISMEYYYPYLNPNQKLSSLKEVIAFLERNAEKDKSNKYEVDINVDYKKIDWEKVDEIDFATLREQTKNLVQEKRLIIKQVDLKIAMTGSGRKGSCQEPFKTSAKGSDYSQNTERQEKEIESCYKTLYSIYPQDYN